MDRLDGTWRSTKAGKYLPILSTLSWHSSCSFAAGTCQSVNVAGSRKSGLIVGSRIEARRERHLNVDSLAGQAKSPVNSKVAVANR